MGLANCRRCKQPYVSHNNLAVCNNCQSREQHLFESYYFRLIRDFETINLEHAAKNTGLDWQRLVEAIHVRLGTSKKFRHLQYWKPGICYVCRNRQSSPDSKEPICLDCLETFFKSFASSKQDSASDQERRPLEDLTPSMAKVLLVQTNQLLDRYRSLYGELVPQLVQRVAPFIIPATDEEVALRRQKTEEVLNIMEQPDSALVLSHDEWAQVEIELGLQEFMMVSGLKVKGFRR